MAEHQTEHVIPLVQAAAELGITPDALRMRYRRGKVRGYKRGSRLFIELDNRTEQTEQAEKPTEQPTEQASGKNVAGNGQEISKAFDFVVADNTRLNDRLDRLVQMLEREQVLRQQMQTQIEQLTDRLSLPAPAAQESDVASRLEDTEQQFGLLRRAVGQLVTFLEGGRR